MHAAMAQLQVSPFSDAVVEKGYNNYLKLYYKTVEEVDKEYFYVYCDEFKISEKDKENGLLFCDISFTRLSDLRNDVVISKSNSISDTLHFTFPLPTNGSDMILFNNDLLAALEFEIVNYSSTRAPVIIVFNGGYDTPEWRNYTNNTSGRYFTTNTGELIVNANVEQKIEEDNNDIADKQDFTKENFLYLESGTNRITVTPYAGIPEQECTVTLYYSRSRLW